MPLDKKRRLYKCGVDKFVTLDDIPTWPAYAAKCTPKKNSKSTDKTRCK